MIGIYKIQSKSKPERCYIGSSIDISRRFRNHFLELQGKRHVNHKLQNHCNKYGIEDLQFFIVKICTQEKLIQIEQFFLNKFKLFFNISMIAKNPMLGIKHSEEAKRKIGDASRGIKNGFYGRHHSEETKQKISIANTDRKWTEEARKRAGNSRRGVPCSAETCKKISIANTGKKWTDEAKQKLSISCLGKFHSEETKAKMSISHKGEKRSNEFRQNMTGEKNHFFGKKHSKESLEKCRLAQVGKVHSEEAKQKMSLSSRGKPKSKEHRQKLKEAWILRKLKKTS